jgi:protease-4
VSALRRFAARLLGRPGGRAADAPELEDLPTGPLDQSLVMRAALSSLLADRRAERRSRTLRALLYLLMFAVPALLYIGFYAWSAGLRLTPSGDVVAIVRLQGEIAEGAAASADRVIPALRKAFTQARVKAVVLAIDSPGGAPLEAERIYTALDALKAAHPKPVVAAINNVGASAAYMVAIHADRVYAGNYSLVGSVGVVLSGWDAHIALNRLGVSQRVYASGDLKSTMNPYIPMSPEAERQARELVSTMGQVFKTDVAARRKGKLLPEADFGSGAVWGGAEALRIGLIDEVATIDQVIRVRWPELEPMELGSRSGGLPFAAAVADWIGSVVAASVARVQGQGQVSLR